MVLGITTLYTTVCAVLDARTFRVPNTLTLPALALALAYRVVVSTTLGESILPALAGMIFLYAAWFNGFFRGADAKVMMTLWLLYPTDPALWVSVCVAIILYWLVRRLFRVTSKLPALVPTALGVWVYSLSTVAVLYR